jgi:hypothetical protein
MRGMILSVAVAIAILSMPAVAQAQSAALIGEIETSDLTFDEGEYLGGGTSCTSPRGGRGPKGANLFFENCWWYMRVCSGPRGRITQYRCQSCPDLPSRTCPRGSTAWH